MSDADAVYWGRRGSEGGGGTPPLCDYVKLNDDDGNRALQAHAPVDPTVLVSEKKCALPALQKDLRCLATGLYFLTLAI